MAIEKRRHNMQLIKKRNITSWFLEEVEFLKEERVKKEEQKTICYIPVHTISVSSYQPRRSYNEDKLSELADSIRQYGVLQPITVRRMFSGEYELVAGERRLRACKMAGITKIPAIISDLSDRESAVVSLLENIQRENLDFMEEAESYRNLLYNHGFTQEELAIRLGKAQSSVANKIRLLKLTKLIREIIKDHCLTERHARALLRLETEEQQLFALEKITKNGLNVQQTEELIESMTEAKNKPQPIDICETIIRGNSADNNIRLFSNTLRHAVELMHRHGINAKSVKNEYDDRIEYVISVDKEREISCELCCKAE